MSRPVNGILADSDMKQQRNRLHRPLWLLDIVSTWFVILETGLWRKAGRVYISYSDNQRC